MTDRSDLTGAPFAATYLPTDEPGFRDLARSLPGLVWTSDPEGVSTFLSPQWTAYTGIPVSELTGAARWELIHPEDRSAVVHEWVVSLTAGTPFAVVLRLRRHDGAWRWFQARAVPLRDPDGRIVQWFGMNVDIDEQKEKERRQRLRADAAALLHAAADRDAMMRELFALVREALDIDACVHHVAEGQDDALRLAVHTGLPADAARRLERLEVSQAICGLAARQRQAVVAHAIQASSDPQVALARAIGFRAYACRPLLERGRLAGTLSFASFTRDAFDEDEIELLRALTGQVELALERLALVRELREADRRKDVFLATLSHELRNPLAPLRHSLEVMRLAGNDAATIESARDVMDRQLGQMERLIDDLLDVSRISSGKIVLKRARIELRPVLENAIEINRPFLTACSHALEVDLGPFPIHLDADAARLTQVFDNLLHNAAKYTDPGGAIRLVVTRHAGEVEVSIADSGVGIPEGMLGRVFDLFAQVDTSRERAEGGLGLGLTIVRRLVEKHGGAVVARSDGPGKGSTFVVRLPVAEEAGARPEAEPAAASAATGAGRRRVLVVDDNRDAAVTLQMMLDLMGSETRIAYSGPEAIEIAAGFRPELILLDIGMPGLNGYDTAKRIREEEWGRSIVLVALTGWGQSEDRERSREAGFDEHVVKPIEPAVLEKLLTVRRSD